MTTTNSSGSGKKRETALLVAVAIIGIGGLAILQFSGRDKGAGQQSLLQAEGQQNRVDVQAAAPVQRVPGELLRTSEYPEAGRPFKFYMSKSSQGPEYSLDLGDGSRRKVFKDGFVSHIFNKPGPCTVTLYAKYDGQEIQLDTMIKVVAKEKIVVPVGPAVDF